MSKDKKHHHKEEENNQCNPFCEEEKMQEGTQSENQQGENLEEKLKSEIDDLNNKYLRLAADFDNYRKRQAQERENLLQYGAQETLTKLITAIDTIERAQEQAEKTDDINVVKES
jgi:molecular chaperone GrpE